MTLSLHNAKYVVSTNNRPNKDLNGQSWNLSVWDDRRQHSAA